MMINPIIPIWLMTIICAILTSFIVVNKTTNCSQNLSKYDKLNKVIKIAIIILLFVINLRFMLPNGEAMSVNSDVSIIFAIDTSVSMRALDYDGNKERFKGVIKDCCYMVEELAGCKFSILTFGDTAQKLIPFTIDGDMVQAELKAISLENDFYSKGSSMNLSKEILEKTLKKESQKGNSKFVVFLITDGEITKEGEKLKSFSELAQYISNGAVLGYGTTTGGKMVNSIYEEEPSSPYYYIYYYDDDYNEVTAISKLDEQNLQQMALDLGIDYIQMEKTSNIDYKLKDIKSQISISQTNEEKISTYQDTYYYFAIPLAMMLLLDFIIQKRRMR